MTTLEAQTDLAVRFMENIGKGGIDSVDYADDLTSWSLLSGMMTGDVYLSKLVIVQQIFSSPLAITIDAVTAQLGRVAIQARSVGTLFNGAVYTNDYHFLVEFNPGGQIRHIREYFDMQRVKDILIPAMQEWNAKVAMGA